MAPRDRRGNAAHATAPRGERSVAARPGTIYVVATPIGNLEDITFRAARILGEVDLIAAEDTRRTRVLLRHLGIEKPLVSYYDAIESRRAAELVRRAKAGESIALVSDAGTPLVADPGFRLVAAAREEGVPVVPIPGPSAPLTLLACAGLPTHRFSFFGFLPTKAGPRRRLLKELRDRAETLVFFETASRLAGSLADIADVLGPRRAALGRELTKSFEEVVHGDVASLAARYAEEPRVKGEIVVAVAGCDAVSAGHEERASEVLPCLDDRLRAMMAAGSSVSDAARRVAAELGVPRRDAYRRALEMRADSQGGTP
jgi:16S rRNA (cytidine1402-2'-O)-methyltransferase